MEARRHLQLTIDVSLQTSLQNLGAIFIDDMRNYGAVSNDASLTALQMVADPHAHKALKISQQRRGTVLVRVLEM